MNDQTKMLINYEIDCACQIIAAEFKSAQDEALRNDPNAVLWFGLQDVLDAYLDLSGVPGHEQAGKHDNVTYRTASHKLQSLGLYTGRRRYIGGKLQRPFWLDAYSEAVFLDRRAAQPSASRRQGGYVSFDTAHQWVPK